MKEQQELSRVGDELFALLTGTADIQTFLDEFALIAARRLSTAGDVSCAITLVRRRKAGTLAVSDAIAREADEFQNRFSEGPCLEAAAAGASVHCSDTARDPRWPAYLGRLDTGRIRSILGVPLRLEEGAQAALNLYAAEPHAFGPADVEAAEALAASASASLRFAVRAAYLNDQQKDLETALASRRVINTAVGIIMFQNTCSQAEALAILQRASSSRNMKLRLVAEHVVASANRKP